MYTKNKDFRVTVRLNETQYNYLKANSDILGVSPSEFLRMVINSSLAVRRVEENENGKTNLNDQL